MRCCSWIGLWVAISLVRRNNIRSGTGKHADFALHFDCCSSHAGQEYDVHSTDARPASSLSQERGDKTVRLKGVYPAMVTPLTPEEKVDNAAMRRVVRYCLDGGVHGLLVLGSTGEFPAMTDAMRQDAIETTLDEVRGGVPVLIGCGEPGTRRTIEQVRAAAQDQSRRCAGGDTLLFSFGSSRSNPPL